MSDPTLDPIVTVTLNPAIDQTLEIPGFAAGQVNRVGRSCSHAAGKGVNVASMLADLGAPVIASGFLGAQNAGPFEALFRRKQIRDEFVRLPGETRVGIKIVDPASGQTTDVNFPGLAPSPDAIDGLRDRLKSLVAEGRWFVLSGSVPRGLDAGIYAELVDLIRGAGGLVLLDTSGEPLKGALARGPDVVKPNVDELADLAGYELPAPSAVVEAARSLLLAQGVRLAVVSMGVAGAIFVERDRALMAHPPKVIVRSTVGAGDAMVAGIVYAQQRGQPLEQCARLATALGAYAVTRVGNGLEAPAAHEVYLCNVSVEPLA